MDDWLTILSQVGFPAAIATFVLIRLEKTMRNLELAINSLIIKIGDRK